MEVFDIYNTCLTNGTYPRAWKREFVTPVPKGKPNTILKNLKEVRKIASTSDFSKIFQHFILKFIQSDISDKLSKTQYGGKTGVGTEHLLISMIDQIKKYQDDPDHLSVIMNSYDWNAAFDKLDPTKVAIKCIKIGIRSSITKILIDFMNQRKMQVKMNGQSSTPYDLIGGSPQGSILGQLLYIIGSDDVSEEVPEDDKYKNSDALAVLDTVKTSDKLVEYDVWQHVPSDIATNEKFLAPSTFKSQTTNDLIQTWTTSNKMKINESKSKYIVFSRAKEKFAIRLTINSKPLDRVGEIIHLGVWLTEDLSWNRQISDICKRSYSRIKMLTKLKYVGVSTQDLIEIYCIYIRSLTEYCSTVFHSSLTLKLINKIEAIQKTCLRVILGVMYVDYNSALEMCGIDSLHMRREHRSLQFALKCTKHQLNQKLFPLNPSIDTHEVRNREKYKVNGSRTEDYRKSTIPFLQRKLNEHIQQTKAPEGATT